MFSLFLGQGATLCEPFASWPWTEIPTLLPKSGRPPWCGPRPWKRSVSCQVRRRRLPPGRDDLWAIPTGQVPLTFMRANEIVEADELPLRLMAYTPCYRAKLARRVVTRGVCCGCTSSTRSRS